RKRSLRRRYLNLNPVQCCLYRRNTWQGLVEEPRSDWRRAVAAVSERRVAQGRALYTQRSPAELYRGARSSERERYARQASRLGAQRPSTSPSHAVPESTYLLRTRCG